MTTKGQLEELAKIKVQLLELRDKSKAGELSVADVFARLSQIFAVLDDGEEMDVNREV